MTDRAKESQPLAFVGKKELAVIEATLHECAKSISLKKRSEEAEEYKSIFQQFLRYFDIANAGDLSIDEYESEFSMWVVDLLSQYI